MIRWLFIVLASVAAQQPTRDPAAPVPPGSATVSGVVMTDTVPSLPVRNARVTLTGDRSFQGRTATTGADGRFQFVALPLGRFTLQAHKAAYLTAEYGARRPNRPGTALVVKDAEQVANVVIKMTRGSVITGTVRDSAGRPVPGVSVSALAFGYSVLTGERFLSVGGNSGTTDDRGTYRMFGMSPGDYVVMATPPAGSGRSGPGLEDLRPLSSAEVQRVLQQIAAGRGGAASSAPASTPPPAQTRVNYVPVFHPSTTDVLNAGTIVLGIAEERSGVDIALQLVPTARISGVVALPEGLAATSVTVSLALNGQQADLLSGVSSRITSARLDRENKFAFAAVAPGRYRLTATTIPPTGRAASTPVPSMWAIGDVTVNGNDADVSLTLQPSMTVNGRVIFDGASDPPKDMSAVRLRIVPYGAGGNLYGPAGGQIDATGHFTFAPVTPDKFFLLATVTPAWSSGWSMAKVTANGRDALESPLEIRPNEDVELIVTYSDHPSRLVGALQDASGRAATEYFIVVFATDRAKWTPGSRRVRVIRPGTDGSFNATGLAAGDYFVAALTDVATGEWNDPRFLEKLASSAVKITLRDGETTKQDFRIGG